MVASGVTLRGVVKAADVVITMGCGDACPIYPGKQYEDWELQDPAGQPVEVVRRIGCPTICPTTSRASVRGRQWHAVAMRTYGQYCPVARAAELLAERWSIIILRNILVGCLTFNEIADGAPGLSRGLLSKRLRELERAGVIEIRAKPDGPGSLYEPTQAGRELAEVMTALQHWGEKWAELSPNTPIPAWCCGCG